MKPARGEQGRGVAVDPTTMREVKVVINRAAALSDRVLVESYHPADDLRIVVIGFKVVAAAIRCPPAAIGDGRHSVRELIERQSRRRSAATGGESNIPLDPETERCMRRAGHGLDDIPPAGEKFAVRKTANLHTGGTIHDVTDIIHPRLADCAVKLARAIDIPVVGVDLRVTSVSLPEHVFIEASERPGLANHEPQPKAQHFVDLLFPLSRPQRASE